MTPTSPPGQAADAPRVLAGDALERLRELPDRSVHAIITDPPYGLADLPAAVVHRTVAAWVDGDPHATPARGRGFMGAEWDRFVPPPALWAECARVLAPGGHMAVFAAPRTQDLMGLAIRLAGFEIRDSLAWAYGSGMPRGKTVGDGWHTSLKPAHEPILLARAPIGGPVDAARVAYGTGALHVDACRVPHASPEDRAESEGKNQHARFGTRPGGNHVYGDYTMVAPVDYDGGSGRFPTNLLLDAGQAREVDRQQPARPGAGGPARFFPRIERALDELPSRVRYAPKAGAAERPVVDGVRHPTVKPLDLARWLVRLLTPPGGVVLDPFAGSGTTLEAASREGFAAIGIEREADYLPLIDLRLARAAGEPAP